MIYEARKGITKIKEGQGNENEFEERLGNADRLISNIALTTSGRNGLDKSQCLELNLDNYMYFLPVSGSVMGAATRPKLHNSSTKFGHKIV